MGRPYVGTQCTGEALPRPNPATPRVAHHFRGHASRFVCSGHERARWHERPRATQWVAPTLGHNVLARHCLARIRRRPASPNVLARHCLALSGDAHQAMPRDLFVPGMNERVGMNDRGRPSGSPLRWDTMYWRGTASPTNVRVGTIDGGLPTAGVRIIDRGSGMA